MDLKLHNYMAWTLTFTVRLFSVSKSCSFLSLSPFIAAFTPTLWRHSSSTPSEASITPHLHFLMAPSFTPSHFDTCQINLSEASLCSVSSLPQNTFKGPWLPPMLSYNSSASFQPSEWFLMLCFSSSHTPAHFSHILNSQRLGKRPHCFRHNRAYFCTTCAFSSLECSPQPSLDSIQPSRPDLNPSSFKMPLCTTSGLADLPKFKIQIVLIIFAAQLHPHVCLI